MQPAGVAQTEPPLPKKLDIVVLEGEGAINNVKKRAAKDPVVRVDDESHKPIAQVAVVFTLPTEGPSGEFFNGSKTIMVITDEQGHAAARGMKINSVPGKLQVHVNASYRELKNSTNITQFDMEVPSTAKHGSGKLITILALVGGGAAAGAIVALRKDKNTGNPNAAPIPTPPTPISINPGAGTVGPPY